MSKSVLYSVNTNAQSVSVGSPINLGQVVRRYGNNINMSGGNVVVEGLGYYLVDTNVTFEATGDAIISIYKDGIAIPGATATVTGVADTSYTVSIPLVIRQTRCCESTITMVVGGVTVSVTNATITVEKL